jgi:hypothetical protein
MPASGTASPSEAASRQRSSHCVSGSRLERALTTGTSNELRPWTMGWSRGGAVAHSQTACTSAPFVDSLRPLFSYLRCVRKVATIPLEVVHAPPGQPFEALAHLTHEHPLERPGVKALARSAEAECGKVLSATHGKEFEASARAAGRSNGRAPFEVLVVGYGRAHQGDPRRGQLSGPGGRPAAP